MTIGDETGHEIDRKVGWTAVAGMLNLEQVLQLIKHRFDQRAPTEDHFFMQRCPWARSC